MDFKDFLKAMTPDERAAYASKAGTSVGMLVQVAHRNKQIELGFADVLVALSGGKVSLRDLPLTKRALMQDAVRKRRPLVDAAKAAA